MTSSAFGDRRYRLRAAVSSAVCLSLAAACLVLPAAATAGARTARHCQNLRLTAAVRGQLDGAYRRATHLPKNIRLTVLGHSYYGRCGRTHYAYIRLSPAPGQHLTMRERIDQQDQSYVNKRTGRGPWTELSLGPTCGHGYIPRALARIWHLACPRVSSNVMAGASARQALRSCGSFTERHGINTVQISERNVSCRNARGLYATWKRRLARRQVPGSVLDARPYGRFGARYRIGAFVCRFAATGLAGDEYTLVCRASHGRIVRIDRA